MNLTVPKAFIRFVGSGQNSTDYTRLDNWVERIKYWLDKGLEELYFFIHLHEQAFIPEMSIYFIDKLNAGCGLNLRKPRII